MKRILLFIVCCYAVCFASSCHPKLTAQHSVLHQEIKDPRGNPVLLGQWTREKLEQAPYDDWWVKNYKAYTIDTATADDLRPKLAGKRFVIFMGTWCGDSRREVPRMFKILDYCGVPASSIQLILVNSTDSMYKQSPGHEERGLNIFRVPDLLVMDHQQEMGRIVESPVLSLEKDLSEVVGGQPYTPNYKGAGYLIRLFKEKKPVEIKKDLPGLALTIKPLLSGAGELNSYAHILQGAGEKERADIVLQLKTMLYPPEK